MPSWHHSNLRADLRFAVRLFRKNPVLTLVAVLTLGLGIGATTSIFSVVDALLWKPLPLPDPEEMILVRGVSPWGKLTSISSPDFWDLREHNRSFEDLAALYFVSQTLADSDAPSPDDPPPEELVGFVTTGSLFSLLEIEPFAGRLFSRPDERVGAAPVALVSAALWERRWGSDPTILGRRVMLDGRPHEIVGVTPERSIFPDVDFWLPLRPDFSSDREKRLLDAFGYLREGVSLEAAAVEMSALAADLAERHAESNEGWSVRPQRLREVYRQPPVLRLAALLFGAVALLLLLACANVSNLLIAQAALRRKEIVVREALGAGRGRIVRQLLTESLVLSTLGAGVGLFLAFWGTSVIRGLQGVPLPGLDIAAVDGRVLLFTLALMVVTSLLFGLAPALQASRGSLPEALKAGGDAMAHMGPRRLRDALVVGEVALATLLLVVAGLLLGSFIQMSGADLGFDPAQAVTVKLSLPEASHPSPGVAPFYREVVERVGRLPRVRAVGATSATPLAREGYGIKLTTAVAPRRDDDLVAADWRNVTPGFFPALGVPLVEGRLFDQRDRLPSSEADVFPTELRAVVNESLAYRMWPEQRAIGRRMSWIKGEEHEVALTVIGVVGDVRDFQPQTPPEPLVYFAHGEWPYRDMALVVRTDEDPAAFAESLRREVWAVDARVAVPEPRTLERYISLALALPRFNTVTLGIFAALALVLASMGVYGVTSFSVARRTRELGIRLAMGARPAELMGMVLRRGLDLILLGVALGILGAIASSRLLGGLLEGVPSVHPATYAAVAIVLVGVAALASYLPARRVTAVDPRAALNMEG